MFLTYLTRFKQENSYSKNNSYYTKSKNEKYEMTVKKMLKIFNLYLTNL